MQISEFRDQEEKRNHVETLKRTLQTRNEELDSLVVMQEQRVDKKVKKRIVLKKKSMLEGKEQILLQAQAKCQSIRDEIRHYDTLIEAKLKAEKERRREAVAEKQAVALDQQQQAAVHSRQESSSEQQRQSTSPKAPNDASSDVLSNMSTLDLGSQARNFKTPTPMTATSSTSWRSSPTSSLFANVQLGSKIQTIQSGVSQYSNAIQSRTLLIVPLSDPSHFQSSAPNRLIPNLPTRAPPQPMAAPCTSGLDVPSGLSLKTRIPARGEAAAAAAAAAASSGGGLDVPSGLSLHQPPPRSNGAKRAQGTSIGSPVKRALNFGVPSTTSTRKSTPPAKKPSMIEPPPAKQIPPSTGSGGKLPIQNKNRMISVSRICRIFFHLRNC